MSVVVCATRLRSVLRVRAEANRNVHAVREPKKSTVRNHDGLVARFVAVSTRADCTTAKKFATKETVVNVRWDCLELVPVAKQAR